MKLSSLYNSAINEASKRDRRTRFQSVLKRSDKSQVEVADKCDVDESTISRYKTGIRNPSLATMKKMARQGLDVVDLFGLNSDKEAAPSEQPRE